VDKKKQENLEEYKDMLDLELKPNNADGRQRSTGVTVIGGVIRDGYES